MKYVNAVLNFFRLTDPHDGLVSLTNVAVLVVLVKIAMAEVVSLTEAGALLIAMVSYQGKKMINKGVAEQPERIVAIETAATDALELTGVLIKRVDELASKVSQQQMAMGIKDLRK